jgi:hypothetical protein
MLPLRAAAEVATDPLTALVSYGAVGIILFLFVIGKIRTEGEVRRLQADKEQLRSEMAAKDDQISRLTASIMEQAIPTLAKSTDLLSRLAPLLQEGRR